MWSYCSVSISYKKYIIHTHKVSPMMNRKDSWEVLSLENIPICPNYCLLWWHLHLMLVVNWISAVLLWMQSQRQRPVFTVIAMLSGFILGWDWCRPRLDWVRLVWIWQDCIGLYWNVIYYLSVFFSELVSFNSPGIREILWSSRSRNSNWILLIPSYISTYLALSYASFKSFCSEKNFFQKLIKRSSIFWARA